MSIPFFVHCCFGKGKRKEGGGEEWKDSKEKVSKALAGGGLTIPPGKICEGFGGDTGM